MFKIFMVGIGKIRVGIIIKMETKWEGNMGYIKIKDEATMGGSLTT